MREIDAEYYGYLDDDDNLLVAQEEICEKTGKLGLFNLVDQTKVILIFCLLFKARRKKIEEFKKKLQDSAELMETENNAGLEDEEDENKESVRKIFFLNYKFLKLFINILSSV